MLPLQGLSLQTCLTGVAFEFSYQILLLWVVKECCLHNNYPHRLDRFFGYRIAYLVPCSIYLTPSSPMGF